VNWPIWPTFHLNYWTDIPINFQEEKKHVSGLPDLILLDEPTSALDVSVQGGVLILLEKLRKELNITYLFVSHDLSVVRLMCTHVMIMLHGEIVEQGTVEEVFKNPKHKHTQDLIRSIPNISRRDGS
jgi:ABC-type oligopeptide transport system ATPase subunit